MRHATVHKRTARRIVAATAAVAVLAGTGVGYAARAEADPVTDTAYLMTLDERGISYPTDDYAIQAGHYVCTLLDSGAHWSRVAALITRESGLPIGDSAYIVGAATAAYCPWNSGSAVAA
ncbi:hypothetical protein SEA_PURGAMENSTRIS_45 [Mycobacterium phage Purgamenstris]|nr:DUF732 domain-containing protein [Mycobacterium phage Rebel]QAY16028.1 hypothetical protein SEA_BABERUTH_46 [Mycobacterium phage BabeRuth]QBI99243.1 hypothetical protein SEA_PURGAMENSTRIS_45 [Mycobacterium phage Purgamenstris]QKY78916.1 hypothetical protein SEA_REBEL_37 [Mycobacterium phage Rebel]